MKKSIFKLSITGIVLCLLCSIGTLSAQEKTTSEMLQAKVWLAQIPSSAGYSLEVKYNNSEYIATIIFKGKNNEKKSPYYLSNERDSIFDVQKVGQTENGKYIIMNETRKNPKEGSSYKEVGIFEILKLTKTELQLKNLRNNSFVSYKAKRWNK